MFHCVLSSSLTSFYIIASYSDTISVHLKVSGLRLVFEFFIMVEVAVASGTELLRMICALLCHDAEGAKKDGKTSRPLLPPSPCTTRCVCLRNRTRIPTKRQHYITTLFLSKVFSSSTMDVLASYPFLFPNIDHDKNAC